VEMTYHDIDFRKMVLKDHQQMMDRFDTNLKDARLLSRGAIYKVILLSSSIIGFSVTLASFQNLGLRVNIETLKYSWYLFLFTIVVGFFTLFLEGRIKYALAWKAIQPQIFDESIHFGFPEIIKVNLVVCFSLLFPRNLFFGRIYSNERDRKYYQFLNAKAVYYLAELEKLPFHFENFFIILFILSLIVFISSYAG
jgi:hypothetical protein